MTTAPAVSSNATLAESGDVPLPKGRRFNHRQTEALVQQGNVPAVWDERDPVCRAVEELFASYAKREQRRRVRDEYWSFAECSEDIGIPLAALERARDGGCPAVEGGRVRLPTFLAWAFASVPAPQVDLQKALERNGALQGAHMRLQLRELRGRGVRVRHLRRLCAEVAGSVRRVFALRREAAPGFLGQSETAIAQRLSLDAEVFEAQARMVDETVRFWRQRAKQGQGAGRATRSESED